MLGHFFVKGYLYLRCEAWDLSTALYTGLCIPVWPWWLNKFHAVWKNRQKCAAIERDCCGLSIPYCKAQRYRANIPEVEDA